MMAINRQYHSYLFCFMSYRRCLYHRRATGFCGTAAAPRCMTPLTWAMPGDIFPIHSYMFLCFQCPPAVQNSPIDRTTVNEKAETDIQPFNLS